MHANSPIAANGKPTLRSFTHMASKKSEAHAFTKGKGGGIDRAHGEINSGAFAGLASPLNAQVQSGDPRKKFGAEIRPFEEFSPADPLKLIPE